MVSMDEKFHWHHFYLVAKWPSLALNIEHGKMGVGKVKRSHFLFEC